VVAAATAGLASEVQSPNDDMFIPLPTSVILPTVLPPTNTKGAAVALKVDMDVPKEHESDAPVFTICPMLIPF
jgi:hypothetical protein